MVFRISFTDARGKRALSVAIFRTRRGAEAALKRLLRGKAGGRFRSVTNPRVVEVRL